MIQFLKRSDKYESFDEKQSPKLSYHIVMRARKDDVPTETIRMKDLDFHIENIDYGDTTAPYPHQIVIFFRTSEVARGNEAFFV